MAAAATDLCSSAITMRSSSIASETVLLRSTAMMLGRSLWRSATRLPTRFGRPKREILCSCDRDMGPNLSQSLHLINSPNLNGKLKADDGRLHSLIKAGRSDLDIINELYLAALARYPSPPEVQVALHQVRATKERRAALEDLLWALLNTEEFLYNH